MAGHNFLSSTLHTGHEYAFARLPTLHTPGGECEKTFKLDNIKPIEINAPAQPITQITVIAVGLLVDCNCST
jgi:hypothetical protein